MRFQVRLLDAQHGLKTMLLEASTLAEAEKQAMASGGMVLRVQPIQFQQHSFFKWLKFRHNSFPVESFCYEFRLLFDAGLSVTETLETLLDKELNASHRAVLEKMLTGIREGKSLSQCMQLQAEIFSEILIATIQSAETTGNISEALSRYGQYLEQLTNIKNKIASALIYPGIVLSVAYWVICFLMLVVMPKFGLIYQTQGGKLATSVQFLLQFAEFSGQYQVPLLLLAITLFLVIIGFVVHPVARAILFKVMAELPWIGKRVEVYWLARLYRTFAMLLRSGITVVSSLQMLQSVLGVAMLPRIAQARQAVKEGKSLTKAFALTGLTTIVAARLMAVGERTGNLAVMMEKSAQFHEDELAKSIDQFSKVFEPVLMTLLGMVIGVIVLLMYMPIFELASGVD